MPVARSLPRQVVDRGTYVVIGNDGHVGHAGTGGWRSEMKRIWLVLLTVAIYVALALPVLAEGVDIVKGG